MAAKTDKGGTAVPGEAHAPRTLQGFSIPSPLTLQLTGEPAGVGVIARFCAAVRDHKVPESSDLELIASAALELLPDHETDDKRNRNNRLQAFARRLDLYGDSKRPAATVADVERSVQAVIWILRKEAELESAGHTKRQARAEAKRLAMARFHKQEATIRSWRKNLEASARAEMDAERLWRRLGGK